jgi:CBS domain containing-hemolysin-like protein
VGLLLVKTLIKLDPDDATPIRSLVENGNARQVLHTSMDKPLFDLLNEFQEGRGMICFSYYIEFCDNHI